MKRIIMILKGILLWVTAFTVILFMSGVDSIADRGYLIHGLIVCAILCYLSHKFISKEEFDILSGNKWVNKKLGISDDF